VQAGHLLARTVQELGPKIAHSFTRYAGKNPLMAVSRDGPQTQMFKNICKQSGVVHVTFEMIQSILPCHAHTSSAVLDVSPGPAAGIMEYETAEVDAGIKIQKLWRRYSPKLLGYREFLQSQQGQAIKKYLDLCVKHSGRLAFKVLLVSQGVEASLRLAALQASLNQKHSDVMRLIVEVDDELSFYETTDSVLEALNRLDGLLKVQADDLSEVVLAKLIEGGDVPELQRFLHGVTTDLAEADKKLLELEPTMGQLYRHVRKEGGS